MILTNNTHHQTHQLQLDNEIFTAHYHILADFYLGSLGDEGLPSFTHYPDAFARATGLAANGILRVHPFRHEHLHRSRMGRRARTSRLLQSDRARLPAMVARRQGRGDEGRHYHSQTSRWFLPVA